MAVTKRVKPAAKAGASAGLTDQEAAVIERGGGVTAASRPAELEAPPADETVKFTLRLPRFLMDEIERSARNRRDRISANTWLVGAAMDRLDKEREPS